MNGNSLLTDVLVRDLIAVGQVDIVVGIATMNHADCIGAVVRAAHQGLDRDFLRERTVVVHLDGGSTDGTPDVVRTEGHGESETLTLPRPLRTRHRILAPYHGVPGLALALRQLFTVADLLQARALVVLDPEVASVEPSWIAALLRPVLAGDRDFVAPAYARHPHEALLVTQLVRPLVRAAYGARLREPLAGDFACSAAFARRALADTPWEEVGVRSAPGLWLVSLALARGFRLGQAALGPHRRVARPEHPALEAMIAQIVGAAWFGLERHAGFWTARDGAEDVPVAGVLRAEPEAAPPLDVATAAQAFAGAVASNGGTLEAVLDPADLDALRSGDPAQLDDARWARIVGRFTAAHHHAVAPADALVHALVPLHLGRAAAFVGRTATDAGRADAELEALALDFERAKPELVAHWNSGPRA